MITSIRLKNFKNFADETLRVGPFTVIVGANASGKSNIRDAFRFLHGIGRGYTLAEIMGGKYGAGGQREWEPIRGAMNEIVRFGQSSFQLEVGFNLNETEFRYSIEVGRSVEAGDEMPSNGRFQIIKERLEKGPETVYDAERDETGILQITKTDLEFEKLQPNVRSEQSVLSLFAPHFLEPFSDLIDMLEWTRLSSDMSGASDSLDIIFDSLAIIIGELRRMRFLELSPERMREPAFPGATRLGDYGENLPTVLEEICMDPERQGTLASWLAELTPMDVEEFAFPRDPSDRVYLEIREKNGRTVSASSASDGTLRFLAVLAALLGTAPARLYFFEEIDTGIHPARQWLLLDLIEKQTAKRGIQVVTTTHSPELLTFANDDTFEHMSVACRLEDTDDAIIRRVAELPNAEDLRKSQSLGELLAESWLETAVAFTEDDKELGGDGE